MANGYFGIYIYIHVDTRKQLETTKNQAAKFYEDISHTW